MGRRCAQALALALAAAGCGGGAADPGLEAWFRVGGARYVRGAAPAAAGGPAVLALGSSRSAVPRGDTQLHLTGALALTANAVALWADGDTGWWLLPAGPPDVTVPAALSVAVTAAVARDAPLGAHTLLVAALSPQGVAGPAATAALQVDPRPGPSGRLVVSLSWDTAADLDLHLLTPSGVEVWARNPNSWQAVPGGLPDPGAWRDGGLLDLDSNAGCVLDGRDQENVVWASAPPAGHYQVRVDAPSLCGQPAARWTVAVTLEGQPLALAEGLATPASTRPPHDLGAGLLAVEFDVP